MRTRLPAGLLCILVGLALMVPAALGQGGTVSSSYMQTFTGMPSTPAAYRPPGWDVQIQSRDSGTWTDLEPMLADHGPACEGPPLQHPLTGDYSSHVFQCHDHVMTAIKAGGYGVIYLTPPALADFSQGETVIRWDMSTLRTSARDWVDLWITPPPDHLALPLDESLPDLAGLPRRAVHTSIAGGSSVLATEVIADFLGNTYLPNTTQSYDTVLTPSAVVRSTFEVHLSRTHVKVGMPQYNLWWTDTDIPDLGWDQGVVQFGHHSYNPLKACNDDGTCHADTWHWSNVSISPSLPITLTELAPRQLSNLAPGGWAFPMPAPPGSYLQFSANNAPGFVDWTHVGSPAIDLSWDGGATWQTTLPQPSGGATTHDYLAARSYWVPVPAGATAVQVRGQGGYWGGYWQAKDASLWQLTPSDVPPTPVPPTPLPTLPPDVTATPVPPLPTVTPEATLTPLPTVTPGATATAVPTNTSLPQATPTMGSGCLARIPSDNPRVTLCVDVAP